MARGVQTKPVRRAVGLATSAALELFEEIRSYRTAVPKPRRCLENQPSSFPPIPGEASEGRLEGLPPLAGEMSEGQRGPER